METNISFKSITLSDIQANILKPHGRNHSWCLFIEFDLTSKEGNIEKIKEWISKFAARLTSAEEQISWSKERKSYRGSNNYQAESDEGFDGGIVKSFYLTAKGLSRLGFIKPKIKSSGNIIPDDSSFWNGMLLGDWNNKLFDIEKRNLQEGYRKEFHALIILADNSINKLNDMQNEINADMVYSRIGKILFTEIGSMLRVNGKPREHFGYQDGISNLKFLEGNKLIEDNFKHVFDGNYGSYLVFMKLEQNVKVFNEKVKNLADQLKTDPELAGAQVIGRTKEGIPLSVLDEKGNIPFLNNESNLRKCPFHAHIRKVATDGVQIIRRGVPYGYRRNDLKDEPESGVGLLFMCFQRSIENQFEKIYSQFNDNDYPTLGVGVDLMMGQSKQANGSLTEHTWKNENGSDKINFFYGLEPKGKKVVQVMGGEYFYAPTISFLKNISQTPTNVKASKEDIVMVKSGSMLKQSEFIENGDRTVGVSKLLKTIRNLPKV